MIIDKEFAELIPPLTVEEYKGLEESILSEGCRDALVVWNDTLIDGHNRYKICQAHGVPFQTVQKNFADRDEALLWIMRNQLSRRNLNDFQRIEIVRKCENAVKAQAKKRQISGLVHQEDTVVENLPQRGETEQTGKKSRDELGAMAGVSGKTYEHATAVLDRAPEEVVQAVRNGDISINKAYTDMKKVEEVKRPHVSYNAGNNEWYTPSDYVELARSVMGSIDLDPATTDIAQKVVRAETYYTKETDGLSHDWFGNVWLNPPYASELITKFTDKFIAEFGNIAQAIILVNNATETEWFSSLVSKASAVCFPRGRVKFYAPNGEIGAPLQGQALLYYGNNTEDFMSKFRVKGWCALVQ
ncbi:MAG: hypothetical protein IJ587_00010 [Synergistaceae bacterium]|nr:hypothetical protein [Synergistaceae bacterium]